MSQKKNNKESLPITVAIIGAIATIATAIATAFFSYSAGKDAILIPIRATQTAEAGQPPIIQTVLVTQPAENTGKQELLPTISVLETKIAQVTSVPIQLQLDNTLTANISVNTIQGDGDESVEVPYVIDVPYKVLLKGIASTSDNLYVYLIVYDGVAEYVQPDVVQTSNNGFEGYCFLGKENDLGSINKRYTVFAVITDQKYGEHTQLDRNTVKAISNTIELYRVR